jgi:hypothetical protein
MIASRLIKALEQAIKEHGDFETVVRGYEGGVDSVDMIRPIRIYRNVHTESFYGSHEPADEYNNDVWGEYPEEEALYLAPSPARLPGR